MKTTIKIMFVLFFVHIISLSYGQTEEYAILSVFQQGKRNYISVQIGSQPTEEREYEKDKSDKRFDMAPIIAEMEKLNKLGFELFNSSTGMIPIMYNGTGSSATPFYSFVFKRKK
jgi:hypothetical protein